MKISKPTLRALKIVKIAMDFKMLVWIRANITSEELIQIHWATFENLESLGLIKEIDEFNHGDSRKLELTFRGEVVLAASKRGKKNVKV